MLSLSRAKIVLWLLYGDWDDRQFLRSRLVDDEACLLCPKLHTEDVDRCCTSSYAADRAGSIGNGVPRHCLQLSVLRLSIQA